ncbi:unnamed protein product [Oppiella nova]|uniref:Uncharacterized protein n=1 Tax=Oppiella nova TaxID=334625 RepID=A0A7R9LBS4_9ACAR|nr:unnamed protein product [Oppiella nova]CAG2161974.1 unnamed protein product [Oppiella nova]
MDLLRNRMVAVTTLSTIAFTVNEVVDQFALQYWSSKPDGPPHQHGPLSPIETKIAVSVLKEKQNQLLSTPVASNLAANETSNTTTPSPPTQPNPLQPNATHNFYKLTRIA